ncbi:MAG TPA: 50S ribosomal protein L13 [Anaerolineales bacterium]|nr:50S ribosomal protein L13 [Anaerolineales bacterium]HLF36916.1 50S ribosomal protein L13 [Anaerolineales bacterium]
MQKTFHPKRSELQQDWLLVDAAGENLGRLATQVARRLLGKDKPTFTPGAEVGDHVVVINASKIQVSGKRLDQKFYYRVSGYPSGIKKVSLRDQLAHTPERAIRAAVWGMLPHNRYGRKLIGKLKIYRGADHPHAAQQPVEVVLTNKKAAQ